MKVGFLQRWVEWKDEGEELGYALRMMLTGNNRDKRSSANSIN